MQFTLTEEQRLIEASALDWLAGHYSPRQREAGVHRDGGSPGAWAAFARMGWLGLQMPEALGGSGAGLLEACVLMQALGRHLVVEPFLPCVLQAARLLALAGTPAQQARWLPAMAEGRARLALAHAEPGDTLPWAPRRTQARRSGAGSGAGWVLDGAKQLVTGAPGAALWIVSAQGPEGEQLFLVDPGLPGITIDAYDTSDGARAADLRLVGVRLPGDALLGGGLLDGAATGQQVLLHQVLAEGIVAHCWQAAGAMQAVLEQTTQHAQQRRQFGQPLAAFQVVQHRLAEMAVHSAEAQAACELAAMRLAQAGEQAGEQGPQLAALAKDKVGRAARYLAQEAVQLHGAMGVCEELPVAATFRMLLAFGQTGGDAASHAARRGAALLASGAFAQSQTYGQQAHRAAPGHATGAAT